MLQSSAKLAAISTQLLVPKWEGSKVGFVDQIFCIKIDSHQKFRVSRYFDEYSDLNCDTDCLFAQIFRICDCLPFQMIFWPNETETCNVTQIQCLIDNFCAYSVHVRGRVMSTTNDPILQFRWLSSRTWQFHRLQLPAELRDHRLWDNYQQIEFECVRYVRRSILVSSLFHTMYILTINTD